MARPKLMKVPTSNFSSRTSAEGAAGDRRPQKVVQKYLELTMTEPRLTIRRTPTINRELAQVHEAAVYKKTDRKGLMISMFAFFATILTLGAFVLTNSSGPSISRPPVVSEAQTLAEAELAAAEAANLATANAIDFDPAGDEKDDDFIFGEPMVNWFNDEIGGWGADTEIMEHTAE